MFYTGTTRVCVQKFASIWYSITEEIANTLTMTPNQLVD